MLLFLFTVMMLLTPRISSYLHPRIQIRQNRQQTSHRLFSSSYWVDLPPPLQVSDDDIETEVDTRLPKTLQFTPNCPATTKHMLANKLVYQFRDDLHTLPGPYLTGNKSRWVDWVLFGRQVFRQLRRYSCNDYQNQRPGKHHFTI